MIHIAEELGLDFSLLKAVEKINYEQKRLLPKRVKESFGDNLDGLVLAMWGLALKPRTDDLREAPSLVIVDELLNSSASLQVYDPEALDSARKLLGRDATLLHKGRRLQPDLTPPSSRFKPRSYGTHAVGEITLGYQTSAEHNMNKC